VIQEQIFTALSGNADVIALAGNRIYPVRLARNAVLPAVVYQIPSIEPVSSMDGDSGVDICTLTVHCWAKSYSDAHALAFAVRNALLATAGIKIITGSQNDADDQDTFNYCVITEYSIWSQFDGGAMNPVLEMVTYAFEGDGVTTDFAFPYTFRAGSLLLFRNGGLAEKGTRYTELPDRSGVRFLTAPEGGDYADKFVASYAKS